MSLSYYKVYGNSSKNGKGKKEKTTTTTLNYFFFMPAGRKDLHKETIQLVASLCVICTFPFQKFC